MTRVTTDDILKVVPITRKTLWLWQKKYRFFPNPSKERHPSGRGIVGYYPAWVKDRCKQVYALQKKGCTIAMIKECLEREEREKSTRKIFETNYFKKYWYFRPKENFKFKGVNCWDGRIRLPSS